MSVSRKSAVEPSTPNIILKEKKQLLNFVNDYCETCHPNILKRLSELGLDKNPGYGTDAICESAKEKIRKVCNCPDADIYFLAGGTQTNQMVIDALLAPYQGVIACSSGHINIHEAGAIEYTGHKVLVLPNHEGKINPSELDAYCDTFLHDGNFEHMVFPGMVYISHPTEYGTLYTKEELKALRSICVKYSLPLFLDGARLGYGLACDETDLNLADIAALTDVFYIGGTKVGALFGEAIVFTKNNTPKHFYTMIKQHGAMLAKGWLLGVQFDELFTDNLYVKIGRNAIECASEIKKALRIKGYTFFMENPTNQILVTLDNDRIAELAKYVNLGFWEKVDDTHTAMRICTSWATTEDDVRALIAIL